MRKLAKFSGVMSVVAAFSHVFCCGLPMVATLLSLGTVAGSTLGFGALHDQMHAYETTIIVFSGVMLALSFVSLLVSKRLNCHTDGHCHHEPCAPKKQTSHTLFLVALVLFLVNLGVYLFAHDKAADAVAHAPHSPAHHSHAISGAPAHQGHAHE